MRVPGRRRLRRLSRWLRSRFRSRAVVLGYHRVSEDPWDPFGLAVHPSRFARHLEAVRSVAGVGRVAELVEALEREEPPPRRVFLTFDDGYLDNLETALPLLERHEAAATIFIVTGAMGAQTWWDRLARLLDPGSPPTRLRVGGEEFVVRESSDARERRRLAVEIGRTLRQLPADRVAEIVSAWPGDSDAGRVHRCMTREEVARIAGHPLVDIGAHSVSHPVLGSLALDEQRTEIVESRRALRGLTGREVALFAYPNGSRSEETTGLLREAGFRGGCASQPDVVRAASDRFALPRFWPGDCSGPALERWLRRWVG